MDEYFEKLYGKCKPLDKALDIIIRCREEREKENAELQKLTEQPSSEIDEEHMFDASNLDLSIPATSKGSLESKDSEKCLEESSDKPSTSKNLSITLSQRKPIVWKGDTSLSPNVSTAPEPPHAEPSLLPTPTRERNKSRRSRYATASCTRGRGATAAPPTWTPPVSGGRREQDSAKSATMY